MTAKTEHGKKVAEGHKRRKDHEAGLHTQPQRDCKLCADALFEAAYAGEPTVVEPEEFTAPIEEPVVEELEEQSEEVGSNEHSEQTNLESIFNNPSYVTIHFLVDGCTGLGRMFYKGQTLSIKKGTKSWKDTMDKFGNSWVLRTPEEQSNGRKGIVQWAPGPWPGRDLDWENDPELSKMSDRERARVKAEQNIVIDK